MRESKVTHITNTESDGGRRGAGGAGGAGGGGGGRSGSIICLTDIFQIWNLFLRRENLDKFDTIVLEEFFVSSSKWRSK